MRISSKARYATIALLDIASQADQGPVTLADISRRQDISVSYLEQIFARLRRGGLVTASRGPGGGYKLSRDADEISMASIADIFSKASGRDRADTENPAMNGWMEFSGNLHQFLESVSLSSILKEKGGTGSISSAA